jgi:hypothetical protein
MFQSFVVVGSTDGTNWYKIDIQSNLIMWNILMPVTFYVTHGVSYSYYRLIWQQTVSTSELASWYLFDVSGNSLTGSATVTASWGTPNANVLNSISQVGFSFPDKYVSSG